MGDLLRFQAELPPSLLLPALFWFWVWEPRRQQQAGTAAGCDGGRRGPRFPSHASREMQATPNAPQQSFTYNTLLTPSLRDRKQPAPHHSAQAGRQAGRRRATTRATINSWLGPNLDPIASLAAACCESHRPPSPIPSCPSLARSLAPSRTRPRPRPLSHSRRAPAPAQPSPSARGKKMWKQWLPPRQECAVIKFHMCVLLFYHNAVDALAAFHRVVIKRFLRVYFAVVFSFVFLLGLPGLLGAFYPVVMKRFLHVCFDAVFSFLFLLGLPGLLVVFYPVVIKRFFTYIFCYFLRFYFYWAAQAPGCVSSCGDLGFLYFF